MPKRHVIAIAILYVALFAFPPVAAAAAGTQPAAPTLIGELETSERTKASLSSDGSVLVTAVNGEVAAWDTRTMKRIAPPIKASFELVRFVGDGTAVVIGDDESSRLWDARAGKPLGPVIRHGERDWTVFSVNDAGTLLAMHCRGASEISLWDLTTGKRVANLAQPPLGAYFASFCSDGRHLITADGTAGQYFSDATYHLWDLNTGKEVIEPIKTDYGYINSGYSAASLSPDGKRLAVARDSTFAVYDTQTNRMLFESGGDKGLVGESEASVQFSHDGSRLLEIGVDFARVWDAQTFKPLTPKVRRGNGKAQLTPDGTRLVYSYAFEVRQDVEERGAAIWDVASDRQTQRFEFARGRLGDRAAAVKRIAISADGTTVAFVCPNPSIGGGVTTVWRIAEPRP